MNAMWNMALVTLLAAAFGAALAAYGDHVSKSAHLRTADIATAEAIDHGAMPGIARPK